MDGCVDYSISGPAFECKFSPVDQVAPPIYSRRILVFSRDDDNENSRKQAVFALRSGLQRTVNEFPILAGQMGYTATGWTIKSGQARLRVKTLDMSFLDLAGTNFSEAMLPADAISSVPTLQDPEHEWHSCRIQANFIRGGLLLVISINHTTMDGYGITKVIQALARNCHPQEASPPSANHVVLDRSALAASAEAKADVERLDAYSIVRGTINLGPATSSVITTRSFRLCPQALQALKDAASPPPEVGWISTHDAVNALCWRAHARCRYGAKMISGEEMARFAFPVDFRQLMRPPLPEDYIGNAVLMTKVELPINMLLGPDGLRHAAAAIRAGVRRVDTSYADNFIAVAKSLEQPGQLKINLKLDQRHTAFGSTSYKSFAHSTLEWDAAVGRYERLRLASGVTGEGMSIILPVLRDGSWEVTMTLEEELERSLRTDHELMAYAS
ncbi:Fumigaclavine B O-acetyltransferase-like protein [Hapsidospora chrysogenum ATCC 11550]|uniref:Fumigaclavine B O-acetyltransferase-like protein n=1 Tax=Hapsidospora chrysogenum (strain ATCC 11550 / CBS 779.69 / DSM 880 / IAM 14645 / JCM 23072 / IMI 49137) TaxID=857340 RepID=A0A086T471_HAPC1|nr:Fumigaclavine B O-acetyltransferase-like protein [Hapsidospora chrysogenum ATCC 11550]